MFVLAVGNVPKDTADLLANKLSQVFAHSDIMDFGVQLLVVERFCQETVDAGIGILSGCLHGSRGAGHRRR